MDQNLLPNGIHPVLTCPNCGQHYFEMWMDNVVDDGLVGGLIEGENVYWPRTPVGSGTKVVFTDRFVSEIEDFDGIDDYSSKLDLNGMRHSYAITAGRCTSSIRPDA